MPYAAAFLTERRLAVEILEAGALHLDLDEVCRRLNADASSAHTLVVVRTSLPTIDWDLKVCAAIRARCRVGGLAIYGAVVPALLPRITQEPALDYLLLGEPEGPLEGLMAGQPVSEIPGLMYRSEGASFLRNADRPLERDLDRLPFPRWDLMPYERYVIPQSSTVGKMRFLPMLSSRGCPYGCSYCPYPVGQGLKWRFRSPASVVDEMEHLATAFGVEYILFRDPMFSLRQDRVVAICDEIVRRGLQVKWKCETRVDCLDETTIAAMARAGCSGINFGVESTDPEIQKGVHRKPITTQQFVATVALCRKYGIATFAFFVIGLPGDTVETILTSIEFAVDIRANWTQFTVATPFAGTPMHQWAVDQGLIDPDFYKILNAHEGSPGNENLLPRDIERLHRFAKRLQVHVMNRHGVLKNQDRDGWLYRGAQGLANAVSMGIGKVSMAAGRWYFSRTITERPNTPLAPQTNAHPLVIHRSRTEAPTG